MCLMSSIVPLERCACGGAAGAASTSERSRPCRRTCVLRPPCP
jgi:hypothetical protein